MAVMYRFGFAALLFGCAVAAASLVTAQVPAYRSVGDAMQGMYPAQQSAYHPPAMPTQQPAMQMQQPAMQMQQPATNFGGYQAQPVNYQQPCYGSGCDSGQLESRIAWLESQISSAQIGGDHFGCPSGCCGDCGVEDCCGTGQRRGGFFVGGGLVFAKPHFKEAFQYSQTNLLTGQQTLFPFEYDYKETPRVWFGYKTPGGTGVMARYWQFDAAGRSTTATSDGFNVFGAHAVTIIFPANIFADNVGETLLTQNSLSTEIFDLYGTSDISFQGVEATVGIGLRYANLVQAISAQVANDVTMPFIPPSMNWSREYEGLGPSLMFDAKKRLGASPLSVFTQGGGAFLFGTKTLDRQVFGDQSPQPAAPFLALAEADEVVGIGELGVGLELARQMRNGAQFALRGSYEGSLWAEAGAPTLGFLGFEGFGVTAEISR